MSEKILIIEDDALLGERLFETLKNNLYEVTWSRDGAHGFQSILEIKPDLVLLDIGMPSMTGHDILEAKARDASLRNIPVIIISNSGEPLEIGRALALGVKDYLVKVQLTPEEILEKVKNLFIHKGSGVPAHDAPLSISLEGKKILWAEDDDFLSDLIAQRLAKEKSILVNSSEGKEVVGLAEKEMPDIVMLDILMPDMDGVEILSRLKANEKTKRIPVIMFSNLDDKSKIEESRNLGAVGFFLKSSVNLDEIVNEIKIVISRNSAV